MAYNKFRDITPKNKGITIKLFDDIFSYGIDLNTVDSIFDQLSDEDRMKGIFQRYKASRDYKNESNKQPAKEKFMQLNYKGKIKFILKLINQYSHNKEYQNLIIGYFSDYLINNIELGTLQNVDDTVLSLVDKDSEIAKTLATYLKYSCIDLYGTYKHLYDNKMISQTDAFSKTSISSMKEKHKEFIINNIDFDNLQNIVYYNSSKNRLEFSDSMKKWDEVSLTPLTLNIDETYQKITKIKNYPPILSVLDAFKNNGINLSEEEKRFLSYIIFASDKFSQSRYEKEKDSCYFSKDVIANIIQIVKLNGNFKKIMNIFNLFKSIEKNEYGVINESCIKDCLNFCVGYYDKEIFEELSNNQANIMSNTNLINKIIQLSRNNAYKEINSLNDLNALTDFSHLTIDSTKKNEEMLDIRYHPFKKETKRKDRSIIVIDSNGTISRKSVNGHHSGLQELYGVMDYDYLRQISKCVKIKNDVIILSADEFVEILFNDKITPNQYETLTNIVNEIKDNATYMVGICDDDLKVHSASKAEEDVLDYDTLINVLNSIDFIKEGQKSI